MKNPILRFTFFLLICLSLPLTATAQVVNIPDPNLRAAIAAALGKASGAPITTADMANLTELTARNANISNLTGLETATNLTWLDLVNEYNEEFLLVNRNLVLHRWQPAKRDCAFGELPQPDGDVDTVSHRCRLD